MNIGNTSFDPRGGFIGRIATMALALQVAFVPNPSNNPKAPAYRILARPLGSKGPYGEVGAAFSATSEKGVKYLSCKVDDISMDKPLYFAAFDRVNANTGEVEGHDLSWTRPVSGRAGLRASEGAPAITAMDGDGLGESTPYDFAGAQGRSDD